MHSVGTTEEEALLVINLGSNTPDILMRIEACV